jgi:hypothetical protein
LLLNSDTLVAGALSHLTYKTLLLLRFKVTNQSKASNNACNGLLKQEGDFHSRHLSSVCYKKNSTVEKLDYLGSRFSLSGKQDTSLKNGTSGHPELQSQHMKIKQIQIAENNTNEEIKLS